MGFWLLNRDFVALCLYELFVYFPPDQSLSLDTRNYFVDHVVYDEMICLSYHRSGQGLREIL